MTVNPASCIRSGIRDADVVFDTEAKVLFQAIVQCVDVFPVRAFGDFSGGEDYGSELGIHAV